MKKVITKDIISVTRFQIGVNGIEEVYMEYDRVKQNTFMKINGVFIWGMSGKWAEKFFNKYGLLIN
ncbi:MULTISPECIES: hypothetical protein [Porphyromonadaceae]|uniref:hypothetical protein n=1 Tax=Porphyromonadaceae TaxID=171551 RepID=UPI000D9729EC|nr:MULTISPECIES: hypothetical protein [Porphyromonadaceae]MCR9011980.1 hypothetical protein [Gabonibacter chumensis]PXZ44940.1 hypothetical protein DMB45_00380 [Sanguibacteroides justesenii]